MRNPFVIVIKAVSAALAGVGLVGCQPTAPPSPRSEKKETAEVEPDAPVSFGYKCSWIAVKAEGPDAVVDALCLVGTHKCNWEKGIAAAYNGDVFVTPAVQGWVLAVSFSLPQIPDTTHEDKLTPLINVLAKKFRDVQYFGTHRVVEYHGWLRAIDGTIVRQYAFLGESGETLRNHGAVTGDEKRLGLIYDGSKQPSEEDVMNLAGAWSVNPTTLDGLNLGKGIGYLGTLPR